MEGPRRIETLVIDSGALIAGNNLANKATRYVTVPDVLSEIRDKKARDYLESLPFELEVRDPSEESMQTIGWWVHKTGDVNFLSITDMKVLALTYMIESQTRGSEKLKDDVRERLSYLLKDSSINRPTVSDDSTKQKQGANVKIPTSSGATQSGFSYAAALFKERKEGEIEESGQGTAVATEEEQADEHEDPDSDDSRTTDKGSDRQNGQEGHEEEDIPRDGDAGGGVERDSSVATSDMNPAANNDGWITPSNVSKVLATPTAGFNPNDGGIPDRALPHVCCVTGDFTMQNVLLGMGIGIASPNGRVIRKVKQFVLKCDACFQITRDTSKKFCPFCGNNTLARLGVTIDSKGKHHYHLKKDRKVNTRGTKYALPKPKGGRQGDLLLREDQLLQGVWNQKLRTKEKPVNMFGEDFYVPEKKTKQLPVGFGNKNPNEKKGRERRGQKKTKRR
eukprot:gb/GECG01012042.1/.p1 GENE.gb/GECG01012042.1/~~gb/GECG01012042.1/.p1  ORF type:complete len:450 (+),score=67.45 gb/GECG01012042.1/:1-1350(+)